MGSTGVDEQSWKLEMDLAVDGIDMNQIHRKYLLNKTEKQWTLKEYHVRGQVTELEGE